MFPVTNNGKPRDWEETVDLLVTTRSQIIRYLLGIRREAWRYQPHKGAWCIAQILEHMNHLDRYYARMLQISLFVSQVLPKLGKGTVTHIEQPFGKKKMRIPKLFSNPKGKARRSAMIAEFDKFGKALAYRVEQMSQTKRLKQRIFWPVAGLVGLTDSLMILHYHDIHHFNQIQQTIETLRAKGIRIDPDIEKSNEEDEK